MKCPKCGVDLEPAGDLDHENGLEAFRQFGPCEQCGATWTQEYELRETTTVDQNSDPAPGAREVRATWTPGGNLVIHVNGKVRASVFGTGPQMDALAQLLLAYLKPKGR